MKIGRMTFSLAKAWLNHTGKAFLRAKPDFAEYQKFLNVDIDGSGLDSHRYDVILAKESNRKNVTLIDIHGGAYVYSTRRHNELFLNYFLERGFDIVALDYPLNNGKQDCQDQLNILWEQFTHLAAHWQEYGLGSRVFITGDSAGGHFALLLTIALTDPAAREAFGWPKIDLSPLGVLLNCPIYDFASMGQENPMTHYVATQLIGKRHVDDAYLNLVSPKTYFPKLQTPLFFSSCKRDFIGVHSKRLEDDAENLGKDYEFCFIDSDDKKVAHVHNVLNLKLADSIRVNDAMIAFMDRHLSDND